jgi:predicted site-specific integrase-resolvase
MSRLLSIGEASKALSISITTLRRWELQGTLVPERTKLGPSLHIGTIKARITDVRTEEGRTVS